MSTPQFHRAGRHLLRTDVEELHESVTDNFGVTMMVARTDHEPLELITLGGYVRNWSTYSPDVQAMVRKDLRSQIAIELQRMRGHCRR